MKCPICEMTDTPRVDKARGILENSLFRMVLLRPFRCRSCAARFYRLSWSKSRPERRNRQVNKKPEPVKVVESGRESSGFRELISEMSASELQFRQEEMAASPPRRFRAESIVAMEEQPRAQVNGPPTRPPVKPHMVETKAK